MSAPDRDATPRREFLKNTAGVAAGLALASVSIPPVHAGEDNTIQLALIGCGGRGTGAVANALSAGGLVLHVPGDCAAARLAALGGHVSRFPNRAFDFANSDWQLRR
jgi:hypothetical protein